MIGLLHGVNPVPRLAVPVTRSGELRVGGENWVTVAGLSLVLPQAPEGAIVVVKNCTTSTQVVSASSQITGVSQSGAAIPATNQVRILPGRVGSFLRGDRGWFAQGCEPVIPSDMLASSLQLALPFSPLAGLTDQSPSIRSANGAAEGTVKTVSGFGSPGVITSQFRFYGGSLQLNGTDQYLQVAIPAIGSGDWCIEGWVRPTEVTAERCLFDLTYSTNAAWARINASQLQVGGLTATAISANTWSHVAVYRGGTTLRAALNGTVYASSANSTNITQTALTIGRYTSFNSNFLQGFLQDWRVYIGVAKYGASNFTPPGAIYL